MTFPDRPVRLEVAEKFPLASAVVVKVAPFGREMVTVLLASACPLIVCSVDPDVGKVTVNVGAEGACASNVTLAAGETLPAASVAVTVMFPVWPTRLAVVEKFPLASADVVTVDPLGNVIVILLRASAWPLIVCCVDPEAGAVIVRPVGAEGGRVSRL